MTPSRPSFRTYWLQTISEHREEIKRNLQADSVPNGKQPIQVPDAPIPPEPSVEDYLKSCKVLVPSKLNPWHGVRAIRASNLILGGQGKAGLALWARQHNAKQASRAQPWNLPSTTQTGTVHMLCMAFGFATTRLLPSFMLKFSTVSLPALPSVFLVGTTVWPRTRVHLVVADSASGSCAGGSTTSAKGNPGSRTLAQWSADC